MSKIRIAIVDDHKLFRQGIRSIIDTASDIEIVFEADNGVDCMNKLKRTHNGPTIILMDLEMPEMDGLQLQEIISRDFPDIKVIIISLHSNQRIMARMIQQGASGYLLKNCEKEEMLEAIKSTYNNGFYINQQTLLALKESHATKIPKRDLLGYEVEISNREVEVLKLLCSQFNTNEIAEKLFISPRTVEGHRNNLLIKTGARNTAGLIIFAIKNKYFDIL
ncbi:response regulator transcription factor [Chryseobacterium taiwanense]|uniref:LuxR family transcriptional regulator n=1 Tax=Chryseobacterium taiwanense TaxID=363331 RepID=A0A0B4E7V8_9FLAO|nr:response regulator transcription factor [Chryseobacterium taiwanense]KIC62713.1 hypothetical protein RM51_11005 [Chryseobacterium taiwanense]